MAGQYLRGRLTGIDAARAIALLGMIATHTMPLYEEATGEPSWVGLTFSGRSSALFAVLAGVGLALLTGGSRSPRTRRALPPGGRTASRDRRGIVARAVVIGAIGVSLGGLEVNIAVILVHYAVLFLLALPFITMPVRRLGLWAGGWLLASPVLAYLLRPLVLENVRPPQLDGNVAWEDFGTPATLLWDLLLTGYYPVLQWFAFLLAGLFIGRLTLEKTGTQLMLVVAGTVLAAFSKIVSAFLMGPLGGRAALLATPEGQRWPLANMFDVSLAGVRQVDSWWWLATSSPHSGTSFDLIHSTGTAAAVIGLCLLVAQRAGRLLLPLAGAGAITLSLYTAHVLVMSLIQLQITENAMPEPDPVLLFTLHAVVVLGLGWLFGRSGQRGPLELATWAASNLARGRTPSGTLPSSRRR